MRAGIAEFDLLQRTSLADLRPRLRYSYVALHQRKYVAESSVGMRVERRLATPGWQIFGDGELGYEDYSNTRDVPFAAEQEGRYIQAKSGAYYVVSRSLRLMGALRYRDKDADKRYEDYQLWGVEGSLVQVFENNTYLSFDASLDWQRYGQADPFISTTKDRTDKDWIFNVTYGIPLLQAITVFDSDATMPEGWDDLDLTLTGGYQRQESNIPNFSYNNWRAQVLVTKRWNF